MPIIPPALKSGDKVAYVSPGSTPDRAMFEQRIKPIRQWGLEVEIGPHAFDEYGYLAGRDEDRLSDFNAAIRDPSIRGIFATRGGKGCYRISDRIDYDAWMQDPKPIIGFSDVTAIHLSHHKACAGAGIHGQLFSPDANDPAPETIESLKTCVMTPEIVHVSVREEEPTLPVTTDGEARGIMIGGNLQLISALVGWGLPDLTGKILLLEDVEQHPGQVERNLIQLVKSGMLDGVAGVAVGQFAFCRDTGPMNVVDILAEHLQSLGVPVLGGLPIGHGNAPVAVPHGTMAHLDTKNGCLTIEPAIR